VFYGFESKAARARSFAAQADLTAFALMAAADPGLERNPGFFRAGLLGRPPAAGPGSAISRPLPGSIRAA